MLGLMFRDWSLSNAEGGGAQSFEVVFMHLAFKSFNHIEGGAQKVSTL